MGAVWKMTNHDTDPCRPGSKHQLNKYTKVPVEEESDSERKQKSGKLKGGLLISLSAAVLSIWLIWLTLQTGNNQINTSNGILVVEELIRQDVNSERHQRQLSALRQFDYDDAEECYDSACSEDLCNKLFDSVCDDGCQNDLRACLGQESVEIGGGRHEPDGEEILSDNEVEREVERATEEYLSKLSNLEKKRLKRGPISPVDLYPMELRTVGVQDMISKCLRIIEKNATDFFVPKHNTSQCTADTSTPDVRTFLGVCNVRWQEDQIQWISFNNRAKFYSDCLNATDLLPFYRKAAQQQALFDGMESRIRKKSKDFGAVEVAGGASQVAGGIMMGIAVVVPP